MIYLDNSATTFPKPLPVKTEHAKALSLYGANPGRSGYELSSKTAEKIYACRKNISEFFGAGGAENVVFTLNCTQALNTVIKGFLKKGDHAVVSDMEHNAVMRPLNKLKEKGYISYTVAETFPGDNDKTLSNFRAAFCEKTRLVLCTHASNVWGIRLPVERIAALCRQYDVALCVDCAQSAGVLPIDMGKSGIDFLCVAGHKGLYGPMGTGVMILKNGIELETLIEGGTGNFSRDLKQPKDPPERFESGTQNIPGIIALNAGVNFVKGMGVDNIRKGEMQKMAWLHSRLKELSFVKLYTEEPADPYFVPLISFNVQGMKSEEVGARLGKKGVAVRAGLHCAPLAHEKFGTEEGAVRVSPSVFTTMNELFRFERAVREIYDEKPRSL